ncbi:hypothetical protein [Methylomagnum ishizawai]|uniref:hypothetical protein n=1 Tax=Methylomagnum ishizawai TaxID=1760988 RepID=UPI001C33C57A|nr:hypothetical protein [Methylomagnum ishizawai]BBL77525.1 hypothetical protein MishRS11D_46230 [Methylomagnum ishizawai]
MTDISTPKTQALLNSDAPFWVRNALKSAMERAPVDALEDGQKLLDALAEWAAAKLQDENERFARMRPEPEAVAA